ncbi:hypothetical protein [Myxosarcina sp. GI1(2024)]
MYINNKERKARIGKIEASMMVYFRERIGINLVKKINSYMVKDFTEKDEESKSEKKTKNQKLKKPKIKGS